MLGKIKKKTPGIIANGYDAFARLNDAKHFLLFFFPNQSSTTAAG